MAVCYNVVFFQCMKTLSRSELASWVTSRSSCSSGIGDAAWGALQLAAEPVCRLHAYLRRHRILLASTAAGGQEVSSEVRRTRGRGTLPCFIHLYSA